MEEGKHRHVSLCVRKTPQQMPQQLCERQCEQALFCADAVDFELREIFETPLSERGSDVLHGWVRGVECE